MTFIIWDVEVTCNDDEYGAFDPPAGQTCGEYMSPFLSQSTGYLRDPVSSDLDSLLIAQNATSNCEYCGYQQGRQYLSNLNFTKHVYGYRDMLITL